MNLGLTSDGVTVESRLTMTYDADGRLLTAASAAGTDTFVYDDAGRMSSSFDVWGLALTYSYDGDNRRTGTVDSLGGRTTLAYDNAGRQSNVAFSGTGQVIEATRASDSD